mmetsp:Transcript_2765/g.6710  ORF Transcript_2765/g.6710 Transcript_2765/m.6710 type:complete len:99 (+) Transcript_2765:1082-1378(+)
MVGRYTLPSGEMAVSEPTFVPSSGRGGRAADQLDEDEGYVLQLVSTVEDGVRTRSALHIVDARSCVASAVVALPEGESVPYGLHSLYVPWADAPLADE